MNSLGLDKKPQDCRVVVAMSGGVDSSATAAMLVDEGYDVIGATMQLYDHGEAVSRPGSCCAGKDIHDARRVADAIGIPHYVLDYEEKFRRDVIEDFAETYLQGETPIPCVKCNETVKFRDLLGTAKDLGADLLVTGHYVRWKDDQLLRGADHSRDQSYFLFTTTKDQLKSLRFPLGDMTKDETREIARRFDLPVAGKRDSQDICFVPEGKYGEVLERLRPGAFGEGEIVDLNGNVLGKHRGIVHYTVGQRRGLGLGGGPPRYVLSVDAHKNQVVVGNKEDLLKPGLTIRNVNWLGAGDHVPEKGIACSVKMRSLQAPAPAHIRGFEEGKAKVFLEEPHAGIAPGQACVFYEGERVLGGGWITKEPLD